MDYGLIGEKLGHSYSKTIHEMIGWYHYNLKEIAKEDLKEYIVGRSYKGLNVTIPYKQDVIPLLDHVDERALSIGAVNTIVNNDGVLTGYNTDYYGLKKLIESTGVKLAGKKVLILGTGGTSKTAKTVVRDLDAAEIIIVGRVHRDENISYEEAVNEHSDAAFIVNTTPCGMYPNIGKSPIDISRFSNVSAVVDVVYNPGRTQLMLDAAKVGVPAYGGLKMLVYQAVVAAELFTGKSVDEKIAEKIYKAVRKETENIVLIGMPAVGKSTIGRRLAKELDMKFADTDDLIVEKEGRAISDIFATDGEPYFRDVESKVIRELSESKNMIIATGGGAILRKENVDTLKAFGVMYLLDRNLESLKPTGSRPLASNMDKMRALYEQRMPIYKDAADTVIDGNDGISCTVERIVRYQNEH